MITVRAMYCPMGLDCQVMTGQNYNCSNASECLEHSRKNSMVKTVFFLLNQQMCRLEDIKVNEQPLTELLAESNQDLESFLSNLNSFSVGGM
ncbi:hypothetical protein [Aphanothece hegewaldii]|uniref:hypothetical protein n=1 Tax=Aphanothece hegewaldii TaxID=1521625 RepID=UPI0015E78DF4|nr:hypothetical protein [Aphanothece hegewaldii]